MPMTPKPGMLENNEAPPSPKQKHLFKKLVGQDLHKDIRVRAGAGMAIHAIVTQRDSKAMNKIQLPWGCFCTEWTNAATPRRRSLVDSKYSDGMTLGLLYRSLASFKRVAAAAKERARRVEEESKVKRQSVSFTPPKLEEPAQVRRIYRGG